MNQSKKTNKLAASMDKTHIDVTLSRTLLAKLQKKVAK